MQKTCLEKEAVFELYIYCGQRTVIQTKETWRCKEKDKPQWVLARLCFFRRECQNWWLIVCAKLLVLAGPDASVACRRFMEILCSILSTPLTVKIWINSAAPRSKWYAQWGITDAASATPTRALCSASTYFPVALCRRSSKACSDYEQQVQGPNL